MRTDPESTRGAASRPSILEVVWPALVSWAGVAAWLGAAGTDWYQESAHDWASDSFAWGMVAVSTLAAVGFVVVTLRFRAARRWFALVLNLSTIYVAYAAIAVASTSADVRDAITEAEERIRESDAQLQSLQDRVERLLERQRKQRAIPRTVDLPESEDPPGKR